VQRRSELVEGGPARADERRATAPDDTTEGDGHGPSPNAESKNGSSGGGSSTSEAPPPTPGATDPVQVCVDTINKYRATLGLPALARWTAAEPCSNDQAKSDAATGTGHGAFGKCRESAQNECPGWPGPAEKMIPSCLKAMWAEGPGGGHYENMASRRWTKVTCGFSSGASVWGVQDFQ
jgi:hypothetical protein